VSWRVVRCVLEHLDVRGLDQLVLVHLASAAHHDGSGVTLGRYRIAQRAGISAATVQRILRRLTADRIVMVDAGRGKQGAKLRRVILCGACGQATNLDQDDSASRKQATGRPGSQRPRSYPHLDQRDHKPGSQRPPNLSGTVEPSQGSTVLHPESDDATTADAVASSAPGPDSQDRHAAALARYAEVRALLTRSPAANPGAPPAPRPTAPPPADPEAFEAEKAAALAAFLAAYPEAAAARAPPSPNGAPPAPAAQEAQP